MEGKEEMQSQSAASTSNLTGGLGHAGVEAGSQCRRLEQIDIG